MGSRQSLTCVVSMAALGAALVVVTPGQIAGSILRASHSRDSSQATCVRLMASDPSRPMPQPDRLSRALEGSADGPLTMAPVTLGKETRHVVDPQGPWRQFPRRKEGTSPSFWPTSPTRFRPLVSRTAWRNLNSITCCPGSCSLWMHLVSLRPASPPHPAHKRPLLRGACLGHLREGVSKSGMA